MPPRPLEGLPRRSSGVRRLAAFLLWGVAAMYKTNFAAGDGMGMGDVKMMAMVGAFLGVRGGLPDYPVGNSAGNVRGHHGHHGSVFRRVAQETGRAAPAGAAWGARAHLRWGHPRSQYQLPLGDVPGDRRTAGGVLWSNDDAAVVAIVCVT